MLPLDLDRADHADTHSSSPPLIRPQAPPPRQTSPGKQEQLGALPHDAGGATQ
jgi:hypothetical protein